MKPWAREGRRLTEKWLFRDYDVLVQKVHALWKGQPAAAYFNLVNTTPYVKGAADVVVQGNDLRGILPHTP